MKIYDSFSENDTREIAKELQVSLCKVTRGAKILRDDESILRKHMIKEKI